MSIAFNYSQAEAATGQLHQLVGAMQQNTENLRKLHTQLMAELEGSGAEGYQAIMRTFEAKLGDYDGSVKNLNRSMEHHTSQGGSMHTTDIAQGNRFHSIGG